MCKILLTCIICIFLQKGGSAPASKSRFPQMIASTLGFGQKHDATDDVPLDSMNVMKLICFCLQSCKEHCILNMFFSIVF